MLKFLKLRQFVHESVLQSTSQQELIRLDRSLAAMVRRVFRAQECVLMLDMGMPFYGQLYTINAELVTERTRRRELPAVHGVSVVERGAAVRNYLEVLEKQLEGALFWLDTLEELLAGGLLGSTAQQIQFEFVPAGAVVQLWKVPSESSERELTHWLVCKEGMWHYDCVASEQKLFPETGVVALPAPPMLRSLLREKLRTRLVEQAQAEPLC